jgi:molybdopterin converting factor subunit 1
MRVEVRLFAVCRERAGTDRLALELEPGATVASLLAAVAEAAPALAPLCPIVRVAVDQAFARPDEPIPEGAELALIPPVSGGSGQGPFELRDTPITTDEVERAVRADGAGAVVSFAGTVRDRTGAHEVEALEYEAYPEMAERFLRRIGGEVAERWPGARCAILHRVGLCRVGEVSVVIAVSHPHRAEAFEGCRHAIEALKQDVPIWKKERRLDGSVWVGVGS